MRGQAEMIGLILILLLLSAGFLLYLRFALFPESSPTQGYEESQLGQTFVNSLGRSTIACGGNTYAVSDLIKAVATGRTRCPAEAVLTGYFNTTLRRTLDGWGVNYRLSVVRKTTAGEQGIGIPEFTNSDIPSAERCGGRLDRTRKTYPVPLNPGTAELRLDQCT